MQDRLHENNSREIYLELVHLLEKARSRLAIAIATESKATPLERLRFYRETEERMHRCLRELRSYKRSGISRQQGWLESLEVLKRLPTGPEYFGARHGLALQLCERLREALAPLEHLQVQKAKFE